jgi:hypothetical protein
MTTMITPWFPHAVRNAVADAASDVLTQIRTRSCGAVATVYTQPDVPVPNTAGRPGA